MSDYALGREYGYDLGFAEGRLSIINDLLNDGIKSLNAANDEFWGIAYTWDRDKNKQPEMTYLIKTLAGNLYSCLVTFKAIVYFFDNEISNETYNNHLVYTDTLLNNARLFRMKYALDLGEI